MSKQHRPGRRAFVGGMLGLPASLLVRVRPARSQAKPLAPTPSCEAGARPTGAQMEGPFFKPSSPLRASLLEPGMSGVRIVVTGVVRTTDCRPIAGALLDFWQADDQGEYDNAGSRLRGHQFTDAAGNYRLETIVPGLYVGRTRHFHVKVQAPRQPPLTTQLYFPGEPENRRDPIFSPALVLRIDDAPTGKLGAFDFILAASSAR